MSARLLHVPLALMAALVAVASFLPEHRLWGLNHLVFYSLPVRLGALGIIALSFVPGTARGFHRLLMTGAGIITSRGRQGILVTLAVAILATAVFIGFQSSTLLLGDGKLVADNFKHTFIGEKAIVTSNPVWILKEEPIAKGTTLVYYWFTRACDRLFGWQFLKAMRILNCLLGGVLIFALLQTVSKGTASADLRMWLLLLTLTSGAIGLFFGYVENYTALLLFGALYVIAGFGAVSRKGAPWLLAALSFLLLSVFMHIQGVLLVPSFVLLLVYHVSRENQERVLRVATPVIIALVLIGTYMGGAFTGIGDHLLTWSGPGGSAGILFPSHWLDMFNEIVLLLPVLPALGIAIFAAMRSGWREEEHFALLILAPCLLFLAVFDPKLGMARDWDLFAITALGLIPFAGLAIGRVLSRLSAQAVPLVATPAIVMSCVLVVAWIGINSSETRSARRFESILSYDATFGQYAYETLAKHHYDRGRLKEAISAMEKAVSFSYNSRLSILLSVYYREDGRPGEAAAPLRQVLEHEPRNEEVRAELAVLLFRSGQYNELFGVARTGTELHPQNTVFRAFYGKMLIALGRIDEGVEQLIELKRLDPTGDMVDEVDRIIDRLREEGKL